MICGFVETFSGRAIAESTVVVRISMQASVICLLQFSLAHVVILDEQFEHIRKITLFVVDRLADTGRSTFERGFTVPLRRSTSQEVNSGGELEYRDSYVLPPVISRRNDKRNPIIFDSPDTEILAYTQLV